MDIFTSARSYSRAATSLFLNDVVLYQHSSIGLLVVASILLLVL